MRTFKLSPLVVWIVCACSSQTAIAQPVHLPPPFEVPIAYEADLLSFEVVGTSYAGTTVAVSNGYLIVTPPNGPLHRFVLKDRTMADLASEVQSYYHTDTTSFIRVRTTDAMLPADYLAATLGRELAGPATGASPTTGPKAGQTTAQAAPAASLTPPAGRMWLKSRSAEPVVALGFGALLAMGQRDPEARTGVLNQTGFQLDAAGVHQFRPHVDRSPLPSLYFTARIALSADQELFVETAGETSAPTQFDAALRQADQLSLTGQLDGVWQLGGPNQEFGVYANLAISYAQLDRPVFPLTFAVDTARVPAADLFDAADIERAQTEASRTLPLSSYGVGGVFRFLRNDQIAFYAGGGIERLEGVRQGFRFTRGTDDVPDTSSLEGVLETPSAANWRAVVGVRLPGILDVRADAVSPIKRVRGNPLLRIVLSRDFPIIR